MRRERHTRTITAISIGLLAAVLAIMPWLVEGQDMPFGGGKDVAFANRLWKAMNGYQDWKMQSDFYPGRSPHGKFLRMYYNLVDIDGQPYHVIIKDNYGGEGVSKDKLMKSANDYLVAVTVMVQREPGYDPDNNNWFWVKYAKDGTIDKNTKGVAMAGRVAKGMDQGCISCHSEAQGNDYFFSND
jgi:hypothetical protein